MARASLPAGSRSFPAPCLQPDLSNTLQDLAAVRARRNRPRSPCTSRGSIGRHNHRLQLCVPASTFGLFPESTRLTRVLWHLLKYKQAFDPQVFAKEEDKMKRKKLARLQTLATTLNYRLVPNP